MPQNLQDIIGLDPDDIAQKILQKQQGKLAGAGTPGVSGFSPKPGKMVTDYSELNPDAIAERIIKKHDLYLPEKTVPKLIDSGYNPELTKHYMQQGFEEDQLAQEKARQDAALSAREAASQAPRVAVPSATEPMISTEFGNFPGARVRPFESPATIGPATGVARESLLTKESPEEERYWKSRVQQQNAESVSPPALNKIFDIAGQPLTRGVSMLMWNIPAYVNKVAYGEDLPAPLTAISGITGGLGDLAGLIGPRAVANTIGKSFIPEFLRESMQTMGGPADVLHALGEGLTKWAPKTVGGQMLKRTVSSSISMAGIYAIGENQGENAGEILLNKLKSIPTGVLAGQIFGIASLARFSRLHPVTGALLRGAGVSIALDALHGTSPLDERQLWEKAYGYGTQFWFTRPGTAKSPRDIEAELTMGKQAKARLDMDKRVAAARKEADAIDQELRQDNLQPVARESLEKALRAHAEAIGQPSPAPGRETDFAQMMQRISGEQQAAKVTPETPPNYTDYTDIQLKQIEASPVRSAVEKEAATSEIDRRYASRGRQEPAPAAKPEFVPKPHAPGRDYLAEAREGLRKIGGEEPVREAVVEEPPAPKPKKRTKTVVKPQEDGSIEITNRVEDDIPDANVRQEKNATLRHIVDNPEIYDADLIGQAAKELARRGKAAPVETETESQIRYETEMEPPGAEEELVRSKAERARRDAAEEAAIAKAEREADYEVEPPMPERPTPRQVDQAEELRGQRTDERARLKAAYKGKTWNAQSLIKFFEAEEGMDRKRAVQSARKAYDRYKAKGKWDPLINATTRNRFGGGREARPKAPGMTQEAIPEAPPVSPTGERGIAFPTRSGEVRGKRANVAEVAREADVFPAREAEPEVVRPARPAPKVKPEEIIKANGEDYWGPIREGGVPTEHEVMKAGDIWIKGKGKGQKRAKVMRVDPDLPWSGDVKHSDGETAATDVYGLWNDGYRPSGFKGRKTAGRTEAPRPTRFLVPPEDTGEIVQPEGAPRRGSGKVLNKQEQLEAARARERMTRVGLPEETEGGATRQGSVFPTARSARTQLEPGEGRMAADASFEDIPRGKPSRTYQQLYDEILADPRYNKDAEKYVTYLNDYLDQYLKSGRRDMAGLPMQGNLLEDIRDNVFDMFAEEFNPSKAKADTLKEAVRNYVSKTVKWQLNRMVKGNLQETQFEEGAQEGQEGEATSFGEFTQEDLIFGESVAKNKLEPFKTDAEILAEEAMLTDKEGSPRQKLARQAFIDIRREVPIQDQELFADYVTQVELTPEGQEFNLRKMSRDLGIPLTTLHRKIDSFKNSIIETVKRNPDYYDAFAKEARLLKEYWDQLAEQGKESRRLETERLMTAPGETHDPQTIVDRLLEEAERVKNPEEFDHFFQIPPKDVSPRNVAKGTTKLTPKDSVRFSRLKYAIAEMTAPKARIVAFPEIYEAQEKLRKIYDKNIVDGLFEPAKRFIGDFSRMPWWNEKFHNLSNEMLRQEGVATEEVTNLYGMTNKWWKGPRESRNKVGYVLSEIENQTASLITNPNSEAARIMRQEGITFTPQEKQMYRQMRAALDHVPWKYQAKQMKEAGFSDQEIAQAIGAYYREGYFMQTRFGDYALAYTIPKRGQAGIRYRSAVEVFETEHERDLRKAELGESYQTPHGRVNYDFKEFRFSDVRVDAESFSQMLKTWPIQKRIFDKVSITEGERAAVDIIEELSKRGLAKVYAGGKFAHRKGRLGYSTDYDRVIKQYFDQVPFSMARRYGRQNIENEISKYTSAKDKKYGNDLYDFWSGAGTPEGKPTMYVRKLIYDYYLMMKPSFALQNLTQRFMTHLPGAIAESAALKKAGREAMGGAKASTIAQELEADIYLRVMGRRFTDKKSNFESVIKDHPRLGRTEREVMLRLLHSGELGALRTKENVGRAHADIRMGSEGVAKFIPNIEFFGVISEKSNRIHSALTALKIYENAGYSKEELYGKVNDFIRKVDFPYSKATRQKMARGFVGSNMFVFKSYLMNYAFGFLPHVYKNSKPAAAAAVGIFTAFAGAMGLPIYPLLRAGVKKWILPGNDLEKEKKMADLEDAFDEKFAGTIAHGIPAILGVDGSSWFGFPDIMKFVPVTMSENFDRNFIDTWFDDSIDKKEKYTRLLPSYIKHWFRTAQMNRTGSISVDRYGAPTITPQDVNRFSKEVKDWAWEQYKKLPTPEMMSDLEKAMYREMGAPSLTQSRFFNRAERIKNVSEKVKKEKGMGNRVMAQLFVDNVNDPGTVDALAQMREREFKQYFWDMIHQWPEEKQQQVRDLIADHEKEGLAFDMGSILSAIQERATRMRRRVND